MQTGSAQKDTSQALFAAGCFWGVQYYFDQVPGILGTTAGYTGGTTVNPRYEQVCAHVTGHAEAVLITFDPKLVHYETLLKHFFRMHDPTQLNRQGLDVGDNYRSAIFYFDESQKLLAQAAKQTVAAKHEKPVVTEIVSAGPFYVAEDYHQKYAERTGRGLCHVPYAPI